MARRQEKPEPQHADGAPEWMVTFSDCMTLLLTFFVLLLSFSSFDDKVFWKLLNENLTVDLDKGKVILIPSKKIFWGEGEFISPTGREALSLLASFLAKIPNRVVISEHGQTDEPGNEHYGLPRAWAVSQHLVEVHNVNREQFSISAASTLPPKDLNDDEPGFPSVQHGRTVEIVLLDRSIHD